VKGLSGEGIAALGGIAAATKTAFIESMDDDFNSAGGLASLFELVRGINQARADGASDADLQQAQEGLRELAGVLGLRLRGDESKPQAAAPFVELLIEVRAELRKQKLWALSDLVRDRLLQLGVMLEDSKEGTSWRQQG
jgi:cysteinyl-tRNA synthetase